MVSSILLAAGKSKHMGKPKQLMPWGQSTMVEQTIDNLMGSAVNEIIVVVGYRAEEVIKTILRMSLKWLSTVKVSVSTLTLWTAIIREK